MSKPKTQWDNEVDEILKQLDEQGDGNFSNCEFSEQDLEIMLNDLEMECLD